MKFRLQRFADGGDSGENQTQTPPAEENNETQDSKEQKQENKPEVDLDTKIAEAVGSVYKVTK